MGAQRSTLEIANHSFSLANPLQRVLPRLAGRPFNLTAAVGRFVWMMTGSNRLDDIQYYDPRALRFSDDGYSIPGSSDGARLLNPRPGLNQLERVIDLLVSDESTRRAVAVIYHPEDAGRRSKDVPCHIGVAYNVRSGALNGTTIMRSCNAARVLPYDLFLFTLLFEIVSKSIGRSLGAYHQFTVSMHVYLDEVSASDIADLDNSAVPPMPSMPDEDPMPRLRELAKAEREIRNFFAGGTSAQDAIEYGTGLGEALGGYWSSFALVLLTHAARRSSGRTGVAEELTAFARDRIFPAFKACL